MDQKEADWVEGGEKRTCIDQHIAPRVPRTCAAIGTSMIVKYLDRAGESEDVEMFMDTRKQEIAN